MNGELKIVYESKSIILNRFLYRTHCQFNSNEVGEKLAMTLLSKLDPTMDENYETSGDPDLLPRYSKPKVLSAMLPG